ncbi:SNF2-related protein [Anaerobaca lacustris]|uniref:SNF2-related protein n=1 Tax=Anaerobaca lacustris TaxID=3044600 RepID=A0AAW6U0D6_9BACT|nr:SNF2-related protein [Sedimentisphaerales bacterium M17dextr]
MSTPYHSQYWAHALTLRGSGSDIAALSRSIANARVDLNPHQIDAALFALRSPFTNGAVLADEVGLGKTVEAGIVLSQRWAERRRRILIVVPAMLRKQWQQELSEKFFLPSEVLDSRVFNGLRKNGLANPFDMKDKAVICSYNFAAAKTAEVSKVPWDAVVIDEAHRLRNVYRSRTRLQNNPAARKTMAHRITDSVGKAPKLLLTATPLQNSLLELFSLVSVIDPHVFGDIASFREQFINNPDEVSRNLQLKQRIAPVCTRALRKQVTEYIPFTNRVPITQEFLPTEEEQSLYDEITTYLQREVLYALPASQRQLITMVLRKLLASSTVAIARTLRRLADRLENLRGELDLLDDEDIDGVDELADEYEEDAEADTEGEIDPEKLEDELSDLRRYAELAARIGHNAKGDKLLPALQIAFAKAQELGAARKAVIFTESRETQLYLYDLLNANGYEGRVVTINGSNNQPHHATIYEQWLTKHAGTDRITGSRAIDMKAAIVECFRDEATILVATEAAAEGVNLQFCSLVANFDLPWNPQRIEQRIGRCHRYGQKHDVVVVNFLNLRNEADKRVYELLSQKFKLFDGVFGASDEVLGALESGVDIERRIAEVYQTCRTNAEIQAAFDALQAELDAKIQARLAATRQALMENFDEDVRARLKVSREKTVECLSQRERWLLDLTRVELDGQAQFDPQLPRFLYSGADARQGWYNLDWKAAETSDEHFYRLDHPLALRLIERAICRKLPVAEVAFDYTNHPSKISVIEPLVGQSGWLEVSKLTVAAVEVDEFLVFAAITDHKQVLDEEICRKLLSLPATIGPEITEVPDLADRRKAEVAARLGEIDTRNAQLFDEEVLKLDRWSEDLKLSLEHEIKELDKQIRELRRTSALAQSLQEKLDYQKQLRDLERRRNSKRRELFDAQDAIDQQREELIGKIERQLKHTSTVQTLFTIQWTIV